MNESKMLRRATMDDVRELTGMERRSDQGAAERTSVIQDFVASEVCWIYSWKTKLDAYFIVLPQLFFGRDFLALLVVAPSLRRKGVGTRVLRSLLELEGTTQVFTSTNRSNVPMRRLLNKEQWRISGELDGLNDRDPEIVFFAQRADFRAR
jgi:GNAT superfamily N-acetyltransferase